MRLWCASRRKDYLLALLSLVLYVCNTCLSKSELGGNEGTWAFSTSVLLEEWCWSLENHETPVLLLPSVHRSYPKSPNEDLYYFPWYSTESCDCARKIFCYSLWQKMARHNIGRYCATSLTWTSLLPFERNFIDHDFVRSFNLSLTKLNTCFLETQILWYIWKAQNNKVFSNLDVDPRDILQLDETESQIWHETQIPTDQRTDQSQSDSSVPIPVIPGKWCFSDGSWKDKKLFSRQGWYKNRN